MAFTVEDLSPVNDCQEMEHPFLMNKTTLCQDILGHGAAHYNVTVRAKRVHISGKNNMD